MPELAYGSTTVSLSISMTILIGWGTYFRAGHSNRIFHQIDWAVLSELQLWLRRTPMHLTVCEEALDLSVPV